jgi:hypothetical protein
MAKASFSEKKLQNWVYEHLTDGTLVASIENLDEALEIASAYRSDPFVSDLNGFLFSVAKLRWAKEVERIADWHSPVKEVSVARTGGHPLEIDVLAQTRRLGEFVVIELKRNKDTERQAVTELTAYANALSVLFPTLPPQRISLAVIATDWNHLLVNALTLLLVFHRYNIVGLKAIPDAHSTRLDFKLRIVDFVALAVCRRGDLDSS